MPRINVSNDFFIRTSDPRHKAKVQEVMQRVHDNGHVYKGLYEGWYCPRCADFKTEAEIGPGNTCPIHQIPLDREREENWFFRLSAFQERLERLYTEQPDFVRPRSRYNEALAFIRGGLQDVSLSRSKLSWGVEVPWDPGHVFYVWFDALLNYYTALAFARDGEDLTERFWPATLHIIGKDILKFHAVFWPAMLMAADVPVPQQELIHGYLLMRDASGTEHKMSKSLGNVLDPFEVMDTFGTDALRYYCFREVSFGQDGGVSTATFGDRYESELANEYGNLASRTLAMTRRYRDGVVPDVGRRPGAGRRLRRAGAGGLRPARPRGDHAGARPHLAARPPPEPLRRGDGALAAGQGRRSRRRARRRAALAHRGSPLPHRAAHAVHARDRGQAPRRAGGGRPRDGGGGVRRAPGRRDRRARSTRCSPSRSDRQPHAPRLDARHGRRDRRPRPRGGRHADPHRRDGRRERAQGAGRGRRPRGGVRGRRPPPQQRHRLHGRAPGRAARAGRPPALRRDRRDRARRLPRLRAARRPGAGLRGPHRPGAGARQAAGHPHARGRDGHDRHAGRARRRGSRWSCTASPCRTGWRSASRTAGGSPSPATSPTRRRARSPTRPSWCRSTACWWRPTRRTSRPRRCARSATSRRSSCTRRASWPSAAGMAYEALEEAVHANGARLFGW